MAIETEVVFENGVTILTAEFLNLLQEFLAGYSGYNMVLEVVGTETIQVQAGDSDSVASIYIMGEWRRMDSPQSHVFDAEPADTYNLFATADTADDEWALEVVVGASSATLFRKVGEVDWSGSEITAVRPARPVILSPNTVDTQHIIAGAVGASQLASGSVSTSKIQDGAIVNSKIAANTIDASRIGPNAINSSELSSGAVQTGHLQNGAVTAAKIATNAVTQSELNMNVLIHQSGTGRRVFVQGANPGGAPNGSIWIQP